MVDSKQPIIVMAGGTGGHVFPALAVAGLLREKGEKIIWMGTTVGIESRLVPAENYPIEWLSVHGLRGKGKLVIALSPFKLIQACFQALMILKKHKPRAVLGMGGFASGPGGVMAWLMRIPLIIHEQNAVTGLTNRILARIATLKYYAFPAAAKSIKGAVVVGNPVRKDILSIDRPQQRLAGRDTRSINLLILGGSLGAKTLNETVPDAIKNMAMEDRPVIRHQCGPRHLAACQQRYLKNNVTAEVVAFIDDMKAAYEWADLVICRAGALTVAEIAAAGVASILVPYPYAVDDHQFVNAGFLSDAGAAIVERDENFTAEILVKKLISFISNKDQLLEMACQARKVAYTDATQQVAAGILREAL